MTKIEFLQQLYNLLGVLPADERDDIIADFEEHFSVGTSEGKSEEQICSELGDPKSCAAQYLNDEPKKADAVYGAEKNGNPRYETKASDVIGASPLRKTACPVKSEFFKKITTPCYNLHKIRTLRDYIRGAVK